MRILFADLRYAFRVMSRTPSFAVAVVGVVALGIAQDACEEPGKKGRTLMDSAVSQRDREDTSQRGPVVHLLQ